MGFLILGTSRGGRDGIVGTGRFLFVCGLTRAAPILGCRCKGQKKNAENQAVLSKNVSTR
jgi:hypothetical protein